MRPKGESPTAPRFGSSELKSIYASPGLPKGPCVERGNREDKDKVRKDVAQSRSVSAKRRSSFALSRKLVDR